MKRVIQKDKPKQEILEHLVRSFFTEHPNVERAVVSIKEDKLNRSQKQNALYWKWITQLSDEIGYSKDEMHDIMRDQHLGYRIVQTKKKTIEVLKSTTELSVDEMKRYLEAIDMMSSEYGIMLEHPEDLYLDSMGYKR